MMALKCVVYIGVILTIAKPSNGGFSPANGSSVDWHPNGSKLALGGIAHHQPGFPLYMMQLYRSYRAADHHPADTTDEAKPLRQADSVVSLTAKGKRNNVSTCICI